MDCAKVRAALIEESENELEAHVARVRALVDFLSTDEARRLASEPSTAGARARIARCLLSMHPTIDSVEITDPGTGVSYRDSDTGRWYNLLLGRDGE